MGPLDIVFDVCLFTSHITTSVAPNTTFFVMSPLSKLSVSIGEVHFNHEISFEKAERLH